MVNGGAGNEHMYSSEYTLFLLHWFTLWMDTHLLTFLDTDFPSK